jgi:hypothetical protein
MTEASQQALRPNLFELKGDDTTISYSTSSFSGKPRFEYQGPRGSVSRQGDEIEADATPSGTLVSIVVEAIPDLETTTLTLYLPPIVLTGREEPLCTVGLEITRSHPLTGPAGSPPAYRPLELRGSAKVVDF